MRYLASRRVGASPFPLRLCLASCGNHSPCTSLLPNSSPTRLKGFIWDIRYLCMSVKSVHCTLELGSYLATLVHGDGRNVLNLAQSIPPQRSPLDTSILPPILLVASPPEIVCPWDWNASEHHLSANRATEVQEVTGLYIGRYF